MRKVSNIYITLRESIKQLPDCNSNRNLASLTIDRTGLGGGAGGGEEGGGKGQLSALDLSFPVR